MFRRLVPYLLLLCAASSNTLLASDLQPRLEELPGAEVEKIKASSLFEEAFEIMLPQPLDHENPGGMTFKQRIWLSHADSSRPVVLETEGYAARGNAIKEPTRILKANQIIVEHRFFGKSKPHPMEWKYLTVKQASADIHRIVGLFREIYPAKWLSMGVSKGGQTALIHRRYYPDDVEATFAYVAPINRAQEDPRIDRHFDEVGDPDVRNKIKRFQKLLLKNREGLLPLFRNFSADKKYTYSIGDEKAFEYAVLEYPFSFWQFGDQDGDAIPGEGATVEEMFDNFSKVVSFYYYSDQGIENIRPFFYQSSLELGNYGYITSHLEERLTAAPNPSNTFFAPGGIEIEFKPEVMADVQKWLETKGHRIIYLYGALDPWSASAVEPARGVDALRIMKEGACHSVRIRTLDEGERAAIYSALERWMDVEATPLPETRGKHKKRDDGSFLNGGKNAVRGADEAVLL